MINRDFTPNETEKKKYLVKEAEDCIDRMLIHLNKNWKGNPEVAKNRVNTRNDVQLITHIAATFDDWVVSQKIYPSFYVKPDGTKDPYRQEKLLKHQEAY